jgi:hypothetical protein
MAIQLIPFHVVDGVGPRLGNGPVGSVGVGEAVASVSDTSVGVGETLADSIGAVHSAGVLVELGNGARDGLRLATPQAVRESAISVVAAAENVCRLRLQLGPDRRSMSSPSAARVLTSAVPTSRPSRP